MTRTASSERTFAGLARLDSCNSYRIGRAWNVFQITPRDRKYAAGTAIEVQGRFRGKWSRGFEVAETTHDGYWVRRLSDRYVLPVKFSDYDVRGAS